MLPAGEFMMARSRVFDKPIGSGYISALRWSVLRLDPQLVGILPYHHDFLLTVPSNCDLDRIIVVIQLATLGDKK